MIIYQQFISTIMEGQQLPKATMAAFLKTHTHSPFTPDYLAKLNHLARQFVVLLSDKSNQICEQHQKKTINTEHLELALTAFGVTRNLADLRNIEGNIKQHNQLKRQATIRIEMQIAKDLEERRQRRMSESLSSREVSARQTFPEIEKTQSKKEEEFDYQNLQEDEAKPSSKST